MREAAERARAAAGGSTRGVATSAEGLKLELQQAEAERNDARTALDKSKVRGTCRGFAALGLELLGRLRWDTMLRALPWIFT